MHQVANNLIGFLSVLLVKSRVCTALRPPFETNFPMHHMECREIKNVLV